MALVTSTISQNVCGRVQGEVQLVPLISCWNEATTGPRVSSIQHLLLKTCAVKSTGYCNLLAIYVKCPSLQSSIFSNIYCRYNYRSYLDISSHYCNLVSPVAVAVRVVARHFRFSHQLSSSVLPSLYEQLCTLPFCKLALKNRWQTERAVRQLNSIKSSNRTNLLLL